MDSQSELESQPETSPELQQPPAAPSQRRRLEELVPAAATSVEKRDLLAGSDVVFSGRCDPAEVRCLLATLEEADLRGLRERLRGDLAVAVPATAGRLLRNRQPGNMSALADDCWELGYSAAQSQLTRRADTSVLKPAGRAPLPPPGSAAEPSPGQVGAAAAESSLRSIIESQLRMERELDDLRRRASAAESQRVRLQHLEEQTSELQLACAARDAKIVQLQELLRGMLDNQLACQPGAGDNAAAMTSQSRSATGGEAEAQSGAEDNSATEMGQSRAPPAAAGGAEARPGAGDDSAAATSQARAPSVSGSVAVTRSEAQPSIAADIAAAIDIRSLGRAIADAINWRVGDSDSESDCSASGQPHRRRGGGAPRPAARREPEPPTRPLDLAPSRPGSGLDRPGIAARPAAANVDNRILAQRTAVAGTGAASDLVLVSSNTSKPPTAIFIVGGFRPDAPDNDVRDLVQSVAGQLYGFQRLPANGSSAPAAAFMFEVAEFHSAAAMDPKRWPTGLSVRPKADKKGRRRRFPNAVVSANEPNERAYPSNRRQTKTRNAQSSRSGQGIPAPPPGGPRAEWASGPTTGHFHAHGESSTSDRRGPDGQRSGGGAAASYWHPRDDGWRWHGDSAPPPSRY